MACGDCGKNVTAGPLLSAAPANGAPVTLNALASLPSCPDCRRKWWWAFFLGLACGYVAFKGKRNG